MVSVAAARSRGGFCSERAGAPRERAKGRGLDLPFHMTRSLFPSLVVVASELCVPVSMASNAKESITPITMLCETQLTLVTDMLLPYAIDINSALLVVESLREFLV